MTFVNKALKFLTEHSDRLSQALNKTVLDQPEPDKAMSALCRQAATEGIVLLKNDGLLPLKKEQTTAFFGRVQNDYFYVGYGSGGDVNPHYQISPMAAIRNRGDIRFHEMRISFHSSLKESFFEYNLKPHAFAQALPNVCCPDKLPECL